MPIRVFWLKTRLNSSDQRKIEGKTCVIFLCGRQSEEEMKEKEENEEEAEGRKV